MSCWNSRRVQVSSIYWRCWAVAYDSLHNRSTTDSGHPTFKYRLDGFLKYGYQGQSVFILPGFYAKVNDPLFPRCSPGFDALVSQILISVGRRCWLRNRLSLSRKSIGLRRVCFARGRGRSYFRRDGIFSLLCIIGAVASSPNIPISSACPSPTPSTIVPSISALIVVILALLLLGEVEIARPVG